METNPTSEALCSIWKANKWLRAQKAGSHKQAEFMSR